MSSRRVSIKGRILYHHMKFMSRRAMKKHPPIEEIFPYEEYNFASWAPPAGYINESVELSNCRAYYLRKNDRRHDKIVYQIHGGAYLSAFTAVYNDNAVLLSMAYDNADVFSLDYRVASQAQFPAALEDALAGYQWLLDHCYQAESIVIAGDSAGAGLSLGLTLYLRDHGISLPKALILASPWTDIAQTGWSYDGNRKVDPGLGSDDPRDMGKKPLPTYYVSEEQIRNPYASPRYGEYTGMPPMLIQTGSVEMLLSDSEAVAQKAHEAGAHVEFKVYDHMWHVFYNGSDKLPEQREAWDTIRNFLKCIG